MDTVQVTEGSPATARTRDEIVDELAAHGPVLLATARLITLDLDEAQDLVQTTFEIAIRNIGSLRDPDALRAWLLRVEVREAFRLVRRLGLGRDLRRGEPKLSLSASRPAASSCPGCDRIHSHAVVRPG